MTKLEKAIKELKNLPPNKLEKAVSYLHALRETDHAEKVAALKSSCGTLSNKAADEMEKAIAEGCEKVDPSDW